MDYLDSRFEVDVCRPGSGTVSGAAEVTLAEPGQAPLHHEAFQVTCASAACPLRLGWK